MTNSHEQASERYFSADVTQHILSLFAWSGYPAAEILQAGGLTREDLLHNGDRRLPVAVCQKMLHAGLAISADPQLLLKMSRHVMPMDFGMLGLVLQGCATLEDALLTLQKYDRLVSDLGVTTLLHQPGCVLWGIDINLDDDVIVRQISEFVLGARCRLLQMLDESVDNVLVEVHFDHAAPECEDGLAVYRDTFSCPVHFGKPQNGLLLKSSALKSPLRHFDAGLKGVIEVTADRKLSAMASTLSFKEKVVAELRAQLQGGQTSRDRLAERLGMSARNLARHLEGNGLSYRGLVDELRMEMARESLMLSQHTVEDISAGLGFSDSVSFIRWFRKQTGVTPHAWRVAERQS